MKIFRLILLITPAIILYSCGENKPPESPTNDEASKVEAASSCTYSYEQAPVEVLWVAYKNTEKTGVKGVFESVEIDATTSGESPAAVLEGAALP